MEAHPASSRSRRLVSKRKSCPIFSCRDNPPRGRNHPLTGHTTSPISSPGRVFSCPVERFVRRSPGLRRSQQVFAEYGNVGTDFSYITREGFGWMNASYQVGLNRLPADLRRHLERLTPPEWLFEK
ncbi:trehalase family glycosidase [Candidatus Latescibacterota bacterium]